MAKPISPRNSPHRVGERFVGDLFHQLQRLARAIPRRRDTENVGAAQQIEMVEHKRAIGAAQGHHLAHRHHPATGTAYVEPLQILRRLAELSFRLQPRVILLGMAVAGGAALLGTFRAVRQAVILPPAEAMRAEPPARYRRTVIETPFVARHLGTSGRMVLRNIARHPLRAAASIIGIAFAVSVLMIGFVFMEAIERLIVTQFWVAERQDVTVTFVEPRARPALHALARLPGVLAVEPQRSVPVRVRSGHRERYLTISATPAEPRLRRIVDRDGRALRVPPGGVVISRMLGDTTGQVFNYVVQNVPPGVSHTVDTSLQTPSTPGVVRIMFEASPSARAALAQVDPVYFDTTYYLGPADQTAYRAYALLYEAMLRSGRAAIGRFVLRSKQRLVALRPMDGVLALETMHFHDEVSDTGFLDVPDTAEVSDRELAAAHQLIDSLATDFKPESYADTYRDRILETVA